MRRFALPLLTGLGLTFAVAACGSDTSGPSCGAGTHVENGVCVADNTGDTFNPTDTFNPSDTTPPTDTGTPGDTTNPNDTLVADTFVSTECTAEEAGVRELGAACTKDCQCEQEHQLFCNDGPYMQGFRFCTRHGLGAGLGKPDTWQFTSTNSACPGWENSHDADRVYVRSCESLDDCKAIASQYTHCGTTGVFGPAAASDTRCCGDATISTRKTCLVIDTPPFNNCE